MLNLKEQIVKAFKKFSLDKSFDFKNILVTTNEAIKYIITKDENIQVAIIPKETEFNTLEKEDDYGEYYEFTKF